jgi:transcriptional regulator with GAF, ATPase, and Fis domain
MDAGEEGKVPPPGNEKQPSVLDRYICEDPASQRLLEQARKVAKTSSTVLIRGESGVGKDHLASVLHFLAENRDEPLVKIDCASLPYELLESELFGYERGAFTGATHRKRGRMELAGRGTIVLDEIGTLTPAMQAKLLRVLEERTFDRLGGTKPVRLDARIVAMTNVDLERAVAQHSFREDLFYRLNVVPLAVPALRERPKDIVPLARMFVAQLSEVHRRRRMSLSADGSSVGTVCIPWERARIKKHAGACGGAGDIARDHGRGSACAC